uniref:LOW QUALITY PROTEIN: WD repeat-containing protein 93 n=1 Tax=Euleptes europaea TaxID=460621 RepID=UPI00253FA851|nr:LOW QUALITY PROTEIN: WD repeat-containing protein 93 [Euleptes europaea]
MPFYLRKLPLEIPLPTEKEWIKKDEEEAFFLKDPAQIVDYLPQPFRMINKLVTVLFERAWEIIEGREHRHVMKKQHPPPTRCRPLAEFQRDPMLIIVHSQRTSASSIFWGGGQASLLKLLSRSSFCLNFFIFQLVGRANCLAASREYIFIGLPTGLFVFSIATHEKLCAWEMAKLEICTLHLSDIDGNSQVLGTVDEMGVAHLFYFYKENLLHVKAINEAEDISKRNTCGGLELSPRGDYAGFLLQGNLEAWLEIYRLPKDSWQKEIEHVQTVALLTPVPGSTPASSRDRRVSIFTPMADDRRDSDSDLLFEEDHDLALLASTGRRRKDIAGGRNGGSTARGSKGLVAAKKARSDELPQNGAYGGKDMQQLLNRDCKLSPPALVMKVRSPKPPAGSPFKNLYDALMKIDDGATVGLGQNHVIKDCQWERLEAMFNRSLQQYLEAKNELEIKEEKLSLAMFHFHGPGRTLPSGTENKTEPDIPVALSVHWSTSHNLCFYLLSRPPKEKVDADPKPDIVWPCAAPIVLSTVTPCSSHLAFVCEDWAITVWDKSLGVSLFVTRLPARYVIRSIQFMPRSRLPGNKTTPAKVRLLVLCTDGSLHLITSRAKKFSTKILVYTPEDPSQAISTIATIPSLTNAVLTFSWGGTVRLTDTATEATVCHFILPPPYKVTAPWHPAFTVNTGGQHLILLGYEQPGSTKAESGSDRCTIFLFDITSCPETSSQEDERPPDSLEHLPWDKRCDSFLSNSLQQPSATSQQMSESWTQLQKYATTLQEKDQEK